MAKLECSFRSQTLEIRARLSVILPERGDATRPPAVLYLLHGLSGNESDWLRFTSLERYVADYNLAVIMPAANRSFYADMAHGANYWRFVSRELPDLVQRLFNISSDRESTYLAGLSMGGYGAFKLALRYPERFAAAASLSGALDLVSLIERSQEPDEIEGFSTVFGDLETVSGGENDLMALAGQVSNCPRLYQWCGREDFLYEDNLAFRKRARETGLDLTYEEGCGDHSWLFWDRQIQRVLEWIAPPLLD